MLLTLPIRDVLPATPRARVVRIDLAGQAFPYEAGQAIFVGAHEAPRKPYSIACAPEDARRHGWLELLVGLDTSGRSGPELPLELGRLVDVEGPAGTFTFPPDPSERRFLFVAGGTGIAPLRAMMRHALAIAHRDIGVVYSARTPDEFAFEPELRALAESRQIELRLTITRADDAPGWSGGRGRIGREALQPLVHDAATLCFICGPQSLVDGTKRLLEDLGVPPQRIRIEEW